MAVDMFLKIDKIPGESQDKLRKDQIDVLAWSWGMSNSGSFHMGSGGGSGKANFQDISLTKYVDQSSPILMLYCANGDHFPEAQLVVRKAGKDPLEYITIDMKKVMVSSVSTGGSGGEDRLTENISLNFAKVKVSYKRQTSDGSEAAENLFVWDIAGNAQQE
jgi:type VI secretion system secreted protein Hcp